jgi:hypothetical protein
MRMLADLLVVLLLGACTDVKTLDAAAVEKLRIMNDMQARATMAAVCDISLGAYFRELNMIERRYPGLVCGDIEIMQAMTSVARLSEQLRSRVRTRCLGRREGPSRGRRRCFRRRRRHRGAPISWLDSPARAAGRADYAEFLPHCRT